MKSHENKKKIPKFKSEEKEREFWAKKDSTDYIDWNSAKNVILPNLKLSLHTLSLRLPELMLSELKLPANKRDIPYQSFFKIFFVERIEHELRTLK